ncbi:hypothetical protein LTR74_018136 [Friedmanniomyces endolithicus]|nr:hypothetical protein LTR74_018136 [Friedmanniomyces endolithicus]
MLSLISLLATASIGIYTTSALPKQTSLLSPIFSNVTIFSPLANYTIPRTLYARTLELKVNCAAEDDVLLATWENYGPNNDTNPYFPIYQSLDGGLTWSERSRVYDQVNGWGMRYQPFLYELEEGFGAWNSGDILVVGNSIPDDLSKTQIDLYGSKDKGRTWHFISHVASGGEALPDNGLSPVWEPFIYVYQHELVIFYSDQRDPLHGQKLVHQVTTDLVHWGPVVNDVRYDTYDFRPGMTTVSRLPGGDYIMTYEFYGALEAAFAVYYRVSSSPLTFDGAPGHVIRSDDGTVPVSSPYNVWTPIGGPDGTIAVSCGTLTEVFLHTGDISQGGNWTKVATPEGTSYTRSLRVRRNSDRLLITGGGVLGGKNNSVTSSEVSVTQLLKE